METVISMTEALRSFSDLVNRVYYGKETFLLKKGGRIMARLAPPPAEDKKTLQTKTLGEFFKSLPHLTPEEAESFLRDIEESKKYLIEKEDEWTFTEVPPSLEQSTKRQPFPPKRPVKLSELKEVFSKFTPLTEEDIESWEKDILQMRKEEKENSESWD